MAIAAAMSVSTVVMLLGLTKGAFASAAGVFADLGAQHISVSPRRRIYDSDEPVFTPVEPVELTEDDVERIAQGVANVARVDISRGAYLAIARGDREAGGVTVQAQTDRPSSMFNLPWPLESGAWLTDADDEAQRRVAIIGPTVRDQLFDAEESPLGENVLIDGRPFTVKGVLGPVPDAMELWVRRMGAGQHTVDEVRNGLGLVAYVPFQTGKALLFADEQTYMEVTVVDPEMGKATAAEIRDLLIRTHGREGVVTRVNATLAGFYASMTGLSAALSAGMSRQPSVPRAPTCGRCFRSALGTSRLRCRSPMCRRRRQLLAPREKSRSGRLGCSWGARGRTGCSPPPCNPRTGAGLAGERSRGYSARTLRHSVLPSSPSRPW